MHNVGDDRTRSNGPGQIIRLLLLLVEIWLIAMMVILAIAFVMGLLSANPSASFAKWIFDRANEIMKPFNGIFNPVKLTGGVIVNMSLLFATIIYGVGAAIIGYIMNMLD